MRSSDEIAVRENRQYGKWNGIVAIGSSSSSCFVLRQNQSKMFPEPLDAWISSLRQSKFNSVYAPVRLDIDVTNSCNNDCVMCFSRGLPRACMTVSHFASVVENFKSLGGISVRLTGGGDCLVHPKILDILEIVGAHGLLLTLQTNGDLLCVPELAHAVASHVHHLRVSVDSANDASRLAIHRPKDRTCTYYALLSNLRSVKRRASALGRGDSLLIGATFLILAENYSLVSVFLNDMETAGVGWVAIRKTLDRSLYRDRPELEQHVRTQMSSYGDRRIMHLEPQYRVSFEPTAAIGACWMSQTRLIVLADGSAHLCCLARNQLHPHASVGYLEDSPSTIHQLIHSKASQIASFPSSAPGKCCVCIDYDNNSSLAVIARLLDSDKNIFFYKARVVVATQSKLEGSDSVGILQVGLDPTAFDRFAAGMPVSIDPGSVSTQRGTIYGQQ